MSIALLILFLDIATISAVVDAAGFLPRSHGRDFLRLVMVYCERNQYEGSNVQKNIDSASNQYFLSSSNCSFTEAKISGRSIICSQREANNNFINTVNDPKRLSQNRVNGKTYDAGHQTYETRLPSKGTYSSPFNF
ncbi:hypothetical protein GcM3_171017 [Golovinomyces cichoracearum]|uniref:Secreted effector protein n=1 Tax=Golovinomyces cichoracearum TaxID=62708 RepID=A0A420HQV6_9PEZI|nr:hypothetical protein GcM3_171017 [Golovinomyces cichoracearum]